MDDNDVPLIRRSRRLQRVEPPPTDDYINKRSGPWSCLQKRPELQNERVRNRFKDTFEYYLFSNPAALELRGTTKSHEAFQRKMGIAPEVFIERFFMLPVIDTLFLQKPSKDFMQLAKDFWIQQVVNHKDQIPKLRAQACDTLRKRGDEYDQFFKALEE